MSEEPFHRDNSRVTGESLVLAGNEPGRLLYQHVRPDSLVVRSTYLPGQEQTINYEPGRDYVLDAADGTIARTEGSRIPDFATNVLFGKKDFDHSQFPGYGNGPYLIFVDYASADPPLELAEPVAVSSLLPRTIEKLKAGKPLKIIAFGDSITAGGEASSVDLQFPSRYAALLRERYPKSPIALENGATGGDTSAMGLARLEEKVLSRAPDLVLVAFGMNDHNLPGVGGVEIEPFKENLRSMVRQIRDRTGAEVILLSTFPPNPDWHFGSHRMGDYAAATREVAGEMHAAYADVYGVWQKVLQRKDPSSLLGNNINHPTDFGHWLYLEALSALRFE